MCASGTTVGFCTCTVICHFMKFDVHTLALALGITFAIQFIVFLIEYSQHKQYKGLGWWLLWSVAGVIGFLFLLARQIAPIERFSVVGQNTMLILASFFIYIGLMRFLGKKERLGLLLIIFAGFFFPFVYFVFFDDNIFIRGILIWLTVGIVSFVSGYDLYLYKNKSVETAARICMLVFLAHGLFSALKVVLFLSGNEINEYDSQIFFNTSSYIEILIITIFWTYALVMMINQRLTAEMKRARDRFEVIFDTTPDAIFITSLSDEIITSANDKFYELSGFDLEEVSGKSTLDLHFWEDSARRQKFLSAIHSQGYCFDYEAAFRRKNGNQIIGLISGRTIHIDDQIQLIVIIRDISERKKREVLTKQQNVQLQALNDEKDKFFSIIAHDLRSPFSSFLGLTEIMAEKLPDLPLTDVMVLAAQMRDSARNLYGLLENLLQWSMLKRGVAQFKPEFTLLHSEIDECIQLCSGIARDKLISLRLDVSSHLIVYADLYMLRSLLRNMLTNAIKFTPDGGKVSISATLQPDRSCLISVQDTGIGMSKDIQDKLFKIDGDVSRKGTNGELSTGLGLLLCHEFVSLHHGKIWVESIEGEGSTFFIQLPTPEKVRM